MAAVVACFHDTLITVGVFSLLNTEISLTVIAAILTLVGYSMNDTIVVFDRIRENIKLLRKDSLTEIVNKSINQTLSRTVLTSGLTFLTVLALFLFGGEVLHGFSLALGHRDHHRYIFVDLYCRPHAGCLSAVARKESPCPERPCFFVRATKAAATKRLQRRSLFSMFVDQGDTEAGVAGRSPAFLFPEARSVTLLLHPSVRVSVVSSTRF